MCAVTVQSSPDSPQQHAASRRRRAYRGYVTEAQLAQAIEIARATVGTGADTPGRAARVRRLDRDAQYVLVYLGQPDQPGWIAAVEPDTGDVLSWADNRSGASTLPDLPGETQDAEYVWAPSTASRSPLYPLLLVTTDGGRQLRDLAGNTYPYPAQTARG
jgi:hypothetical protein